MKTFNNIYEIEIPNVYNSNSGISLYNKICLLKECCPSVLYYYKNTKCKYYRLGIVIRASSQVDHYKAITNFICWIAETYRIITTPLKVKSKISKNYLHINPNLFEPYALRSIISSIETIRSWGIDIDEHSLLENPGF